MNHSLLPPLLLSYRPFQKQWLIAYLNAAKDEKLHVKNMTDQQVEDFLDLIEFFTLLSHLFWGRYFNNFKRKKNA